MKRRTLGMLVVCVTMTYLGPSICTAADIKVMYAIGLLDYGENARLLTTEEFNQTVANYEKFRDRVAKAPTLKEMVQSGWSIMHVEQIRAGENPYRELNYLIIFQGGRRR